MKSPAAVARAATPKMTIRAMSQGEAPPLGGDPPLLELFLTAAADCPDPVIFGGA
jgi:hypothetical protein